MPAQPEPTDRAEVQKLANAVEEALAGEMRTSYRSDNPDVPSWQEGSRIGTTPPVQQPGRAAMSQRAVDLNTTILSISVLTASLGGAASAILWATSYADPTVIKWICVCAVAVPAALAIPVLALKGLMKSAKEVVQAAPPQHHHHYNAPVDQREIHSRTSGVWVRNNNQQ
jgi:hypothetical protein